MVIAVFIRNIVTQTYINFEHAVIKKRNSIASFFYVFVIFEK